MRVLLVGGGGREHALAWTISRSPELGELIAAPGNPGMGRLARLAPVGAEDVGGLTDLAANEGVDLVVAGPEAPLAAGAGRSARRAGHSLFRAASGRRAPRGLEGVRQGLHGPARDSDGPAYGGPRHGGGAPGASFRRLRRATGHQGERPCRWQRGVPARDLDAAERDATRLLEGGLGDAGKAVVIEERLNGPELSVFAISDGTRVVACGPPRTTSGASRTTRDPTRVGWEA